jgi:hypothetical protein
VGQVGALLSGQRTDRATDRSGVLGIADDGQGATGISANNTGVFGQGAQFGGHFVAKGSGDGVLGETSGIDRSGVVGVAQNGQKATGVLGIADSGVGISGISANNTGVFAVRRVRAIRVQRAR